MIGLLIGACAACAGVAMLGSKKHTVGKSDAAVNRSLPVTTNPDYQIPYVEKWVDEWAAEGRAMGLRGEELTLFVLNNAFGATHSNKRINWPARRDPFLKAFQARVHARANR